MREFWRSLGVFGGSVGRFSGRGESGRGGLSGGVVKGARVANPFVGAGFAALEEEQPTVVAGR